ncbi:MAG: hypothetical protein LBR08_07010 [Bacteroidales bacterium]|jgi:uncharacterized protein YfaS (alpha-2-macroglobulin family)|nr:hypothetical protein [Bacteroidales bacterium]
MLPQFKIRSGIILAGFALLSGLSGCRSKQEIDTEHPAIVAYTFGTVSILSPVRVVLVDDAEGASHQVGDQAEDGIFSFSPSVSGKTYWTSENTLEFRPDEAFKPGQEYRVKFHVAKVAQVAGAKKTFTFRITTIVPTFYRQMDGLSLYGRRQPNLYYFSGSITTSDHIPAEKVENLLQVSSPQGKRDVKWEHDYALNRHFFRIDSIRSEGRRYDLSFAWDGKGIGYDFTQEETVSVPAEDEFGLIDVQVIHSPEQYVQCTFSEAIDEKQKLSDYFSLSNNALLRFSVDLNIVKVYPAAHETGTHTLTIEKGLKSVTKKPLEETVRHEVVFEELKPSVKFVGKGVILPNSNGLHVNFQAVNYQSVYVTVYRIYESNILQFLQVNRLDEEDQLYRVGRQILRERIDLAEKKAVNLSVWNTFSLDLARLIMPEPGAIYRIELEGYQKLTEGDDDDYDYQDYYTRYRNRHRNILATDIGLTAKTGDGKELYVAASNLITADPMANVQIKAYDSFNQLTGEGVTDKEGLAVIRCSESPAVVVAQEGKQKSYLKTDYHALSLSNFDVSGVAAEHGLKGFIFGERGVWRPGDTLFLAFMLEDKNKTLPENHPVNFELRDPNGQVADKQVKTSGANGLYRFTVPTGSEALTGVWEARINVGGAYFEKNLKIETVKPNRLKIDLKLKHTPILSGEGLTGKISAHWLHGAVARNLNVRIYTRISKTATKFKGYDDYVFEDPAVTFYSEEKTLLESRLDNEGTLEFSEDPDVAESPGMLRVFVSTRVFEEGGDFSTDEFVTTYSPFASYIGVKPPKGTGYYNRLEIGEEQTFDVVTVDEEGKPVSRRNIDVEVYKVGWSWWWSSTHGEAGYSEGSYSSPVYSTTVNTQNGKGQFKHQWNDNGYYIVRMTDPESNHTAAVPVYASYSWWYGDGESDDNGGATMLQLAVEKPSYNIGEEATVTFPAAEGAKALVTIESGSDVKRTFWVSCKSAEGKVSITTTPDMVPNVYVHVSLIQPHANTGNDAPVRLYGVVPLMVEDPLTRLHPEIDMPDVLQPEEPFKVKIREKNGQVMTYTLAIVDDGLLDLTRYKTPDPWSAFYAREALGIRTWDIYDYVIGAYGGKIEQLFAIGGDAEMSEDALNKKETAKAQRFKPVVRYTGPFTVEKGKTNEHKITLPPYVGSVRTMVVATNGRGYGSEAKTTPVRKPLMTLATLPRTAGPGEEIWVPVTVFAMEDRIRQANVEISVNDMFTVEGGKKQSVTFTAQGDQTVYFKLKAKDYTGTGKVTATVSSGSEKAEHVIELEVRNPNPVVYTFAETLVEAGKSWESEYVLPGMKGTGKAVIEASYLPPINLGRRLHYLIHYPHGCIEQTTSSVFPQLYLDNVMELNTQSKRNIENNIKAGLNRLRLFITPQGGFGYWPGSYTPNSWGSSYGGHFMLEAENKGYALPAGMKQAWLRYQTGRASNWRSNEGDDINQAYRLYTLALAKQPDLSAMNRLKEYEKLSEQAKWRLAAAYALAGKPEAAKSLTAGAATFIETYRNLFNEHFGSSERDMAMILETLTLLQDRTKAFPVVKKLSDALNENRWMSTQTTAYSLLAIAKYAAGETGDKEINIEYTDAGKSQKAVSKMPVWQADLNVEGKTGSEKMKFKNNSSVPLYVRITASGIPAPGNETASAHGLVMSVRFVNENNNEINIAQLPQGADFKAIVTVSNPVGNGNYTNLTLSQIFPSGWEIVNTRLNDGSTASGSSPFDYIDIRDDRVYTYFSLNSGAAKTFAVQLSAAYAGRFYLPAFSCEAMYDASVKANTEGKWIEVTR